MDAASTAHVSLRWTMPSLDNAFTGTDSVLEKDLKGEAKSMTSRLVVMNNAFGTSGTDESQTRRHLVRQTERPPVLHKEQH
jgi:hypothetical protein